MSAVAGIPSLSQLVVWPTGHLTEAADHWESVGARSYDVAHRVWRDALSADWHGESAEALRTATHADMLTTSAVVDKLQAAAKVARSGASDLYAARSRVRYAVQDANAAGFDVDEEMSVIDRSTGGSAAERAARQAQAQALAADIRQRAAQLVALDQQVAGKVTAAVAGIGEAFRNTPSTPSTISQPPQSKIRAVDNHTFKQDPASPKPPSDPTGMTPDQARSAYERLKTEIRDHNSWLPPTNDAGAVAAYNREAEELNARKAGLEAKLGKAETLPAQGTRLVPDWAQPAPEQQPGHPNPAAPQPSPFDLTTPHAHDLGRDPANGGFRMSEAETGLRVEAERGVDLVRSVHPGFDWVNPGAIFRCAMATLARKDT
ncbi:hypothetical protein [Mycobacterium palustre]|uniref:hypothetical protein n=1 Tax=Mycobacterium palustre TaxID=153971 RepID=UPI001FE99E55|nr:hypothetical protein [Mycobacterium palustre]